MSREIGWFLVTMHRHSTQPRLIAVEAEDRGEAIKVIRVRLAQDPLASEFSIDRISDVLPISGEAYP